MLLRASLAAPLGLLITPYAVHAWRIFDNTYCGPIPLDTDTQLAKDSQKNATTEVCNKLDSSYVVDMAITDDHYNPIGHGYACAGTDGHGFSNGCIDCLCQQQEPKGYFHAWSGGNEESHTVACADGCRNKS